jgi:ABC-type Na+ transport system ATPase subunit NatA
MREVELLAERVVFLARGRVVANDTPAAIADAFGHDDLEGVFLALAGRDAEEI